MFLLFLVLGGSSCLGRGGGTLFVGWGVPPFAIGYSDTERTNLKVATVATL